MPRTVIIHPVLLGILGGAFVLLLGARSTPRGSQGQPLLLLPRTRAVQNYQSACQGWTRQLETLDGDLASLLRADSADILVESGLAQNDLERSAQIEQAIDGRQPPAVLAGLAGELRQTARDYQDAAQAAAQAVSFPDVAHRQGAQAALERAHKDLGALEKDPWMTNEP
jgi:hypothetical protein